MSNFDSNWLRKPTDAQHHHGIDVDVRTHVDAHRKKIVNNNKLLYVTLFSTQRQVSPCETARCTSGKDFNQKTACRPHREKKKNAKVVLDRMRRLGPGKKQQNRSKHLCSHSHHSKDHGRLQVHISNLSFFLSFFHSCFFFLSLSFSLSLFLFACTLRKGPGSCVHVCPRPCFEHLSMGQARNPPTLGTTLNVYPVLSCPLWPCTHRMCVIAKENHHQKNGDNSS